MGKRVIFPDFGTHKKRMNQGQKYVNSQQQLPKAKRRQAKKLSEDKKDDGNA